MMQKRNHGVNGLTAGYISNLPESAVMDCSEPGADASVYVPAGSHYATHCDGCYVIICGAMWR